jgi:hypothetical protein
VLGTIGVGYAVFVAATAPDGTTAERVGRSVDLLIRVGGGCLLLGIGVPLYVAGSHRIDEARRKGYAIKAMVIPVRGGAIAGLTLGNF